MQRSEEEDGESAHKSFVMSRWRLTHDYVVRISMRLFSHISQLLLTSILLLRLLPPPPLLPTSPSDSMSRQPQEAFGSTPTPAITATIFAATEDDVRRELDSCQTMNSITAWKVETSHSLFWAKPAAVTLNKSTKISYAPLLLWKSF